MSAADLRGDLSSLGDHIVGEYGDEQLLAEWEQAKATDAADRDAWARMKLLDSLKNGEYWQARKRARLEEQRRAARRMTRKRALAEGAAATFTTGRQLAAERSRSGMSQDQLARAAGIRRSAISKIERGRRSLGFEEACRLVEALGCSLEQLRPL